MIRKFQAIVFGMLLLLTGCIERFFPGEDDLQTGTLVVVAHLSGHPGLQTINLSQSSMLHLPLREPLSGCIVEIEKADGTIREFGETIEGEYSGMLDESFLKVGDQYRLNFVTPDGNRYESEFEEVLPAPKIQSVYFEREDRPTSDPDVVDKGIQFFVDFEIEKDSGRYLRWQLMETYELHNPDYLETQVYDVDRQFKDITDTLGWRTCWITREVPEIFTQDMGDVDGEIYHRLPLNYVSNQSQRLNFGYSLLVRQMSLSEDSFWYWNELRKNLQTKGGLFDTQPSLTPSNICNVDNEDELIIGYFGISGVSEQRIFVENVPDLELFEDPYFCAPGGLPKSWWRLTQAFLPYYLARHIVDGMSVYGNVKRECIDCREYKGSTHMIPDFWE